MQALIIKTALLVFQLLAYVLAKKSNVLFVWLAFRVVVELFLALSVVLGLPLTAVCEKTKKHSIIHSHKII